MNALSSKILTLLTLLAFLAVSPGFVISQVKPVGELTIESNAINGGEAFVIVNNERVISGRSVFSPVEIETPAQTTAKISLAGTGIIKIAPDSKMNLYFGISSISGDFLKGNLTVDGLPNTNFNILTPDGAITGSNLSQENVFVVTIVNNKTQVKTLTGEVLFNKILLVAGQSYPAQVTGQNSSTVPAVSGNSNSSNILLITLGVVGAVAVVAALALSGGNNNNTVVSPTR